MTRTRLLRPVTKNEIRNYQEHGVVHLRQIIGREWVELLAEGLNEVFYEVWGTQDVQYDLTAMANETRRNGGVVLTDPRAEAMERRGRFLSAISSWTYNDKIRSVALESPLAEVAAALFRSDKVNFYDDQILLKEPGSKEYTAFHTDEPYYHLRGEQICAIWMSPDRVDDDNSPMRYVRGSHRWPSRFRPNVFVAQTPMYDSEELEPLPDIEGNEEAYDVVTIPAEPGDVIVHHSRLAHGSRPNYDPERTRRAASFRYTGDDVRYWFHPSAPPQPHHHHHLADGDVLDCDQFPVTWRRGAMTA